MKPRTRNKPAARSMCQNRGSIITFLLSREHVLSGGPTALTCGRCHGDSPAYGSLSPATARRSACRPCQLPGGRDVAVEGVAAGLARLEEREGGLARGHWNMDIERVDVEVVPCGVAVLQSE